MYSVYGVAALLGTFAVILLQRNIGYNSMLIICLGMTLVSALTTYCYRFERINYAKLAGNDDKQDVELNTEKELFFPPHVKGAKVLLGI